jgi:hypothetical protein
MVLLKFEIDPRQGRKDREKISTRIDEVMKIHQLLSLLS